MEDLLKIHLEKIEAGKLSIPPIRWLTSKNRHFSELHSPEKYKYKIMNAPIESITHWKYDKKPKLYSEQPGQYMAIEFIAQSYREHEPSGNEIEEAYRAKFVFNNPNSEVEISTPIGRIDCILNDSIIELKSSKKWKEGFGQLLAYAFYYPEYRKILLLFGSISKEAFEKINIICKEYSVELKLC
jgi:hypothetical protein